MISRKMKWVVTGASGMLGSDLIELLSSEGEECIGLSRAELDVSDRETSRARIIEIAPDVIVNCAAYTKVDDAETSEELALSINGAAVRGLAGAADECDALLVQLSTDFVFDGRQETPYEVDAPVAPLSAYGRTKLAGEEAARDAQRHLIVRTSWLFGPHGPNFVEAMRKQIAAGRHELRVVSDQRGRPTYTPHLARAVVALARVAAADETRRGVFHYADTPECTWFDFATEIVEQLKAKGQAPSNGRVEPVSSSEFPRPAARPAYSVLSTRRYEAATGRRPESWKEGLQEYFASERRV
jgi:dTDP-4-dehydrorhamnose reductase